LIGGFITRGKAAFTRVLAATFAAMIAYGLVFADAIAALRFSADCHE